MTKENFSRIGTTVNAPGELNGIIGEIEEAFDNFLSRDGEAPNSMEANLDMNGKRILNLPTPVSPTEPVRVADLGVISGDVAALNAAVAAAEAAADEATAAANSSAGYVLVTNHGWSNTGTLASKQAAWIAARDYAISSGIYKVKFPSTNGLPVDVPQMDLPDFTANDDTQSPGRQLEISGVDELSTYFRLGDSAARYMFGHPSYGSLVNRAQNSFVKINNMRLWGLRDFTKSAPVIALSNTWAFEIKNLLVGGCPGGNCINIWSFSRGGAQTGDIVRVRGMKDRAWTNPVTPGKKPFYSLATLAEEGFRYLVGLYGPVDGVGKCNNIKIVACEGYTGLMGMVDTKPFESDPPADFESIVFPDGGGVDFLTIDGMFGGYESTSKMEDGNILSAPSSTVIQLPTTVGDYADHTDKFVNCVLRLRNDADNLTYSRKIVAGHTSNRQVTVESAFPWTLAGDEHYEISYADAQAWAEGMHPEILKHNLRWGTRTWRANIVNSRVEEGSLACKMSYAKNHVAISNSASYSDRSRGFMVWDSTAGEYAQSWAPASYVADQPRGADGCTANISGPVHMMGDPEDPGGVPAIQVIPRINNTGGVLTNGSIVSFASNNVNVNSPFLWSATAGKVIHRPIWNSTARDIQPGDLVSVVWSGITKVRIKPTANQVIAAGDILVSSDATSGAGVVIAYATWVATPANFPKAIGTIVGNYTDPGTAAEVQLWVAVGK